MKTKQLWYTIICAIMMALGLIVMGYTLVKLDYILSTIGAIGALWMFSISLIVANLGVHFLERDL